MKHTKVAALLSAIMFIVSACGAQPVPTLSGADVQHTAEAAAFTLVAQTQAAVPTATPVPPTETPTQTAVPTDTPAVTPTLEVTFTAVPPTTNPNADPCATRVLSGSPSGKETTIKIVNTTRAAITISLYLNETEGAGECGYRGYTLGPRGETIISDLVYGCYNMWAWSNTGERTRVNASGFGCINNSDKWTFEISENGIKLSPP